MVLQGLIRTKKPTVTQQGVWRQAGCCFVGHFAGIWKFTSRPSLCETPPAAKPLKRWLQAVYSVAYNDSAVEMKPKN